MVSKEFLREVIIEGRKEMEEIFEREQIIEREMKARAKEFIRIPKYISNTWCKKSRKVFIGMASI